MANIIYLYRVPKYNGISIDQIHLISSYLEWRHECTIGSPYASETFESWNGKSLCDLPSIEVIEYYRPYFDRPYVANDGTDGYVCQGIFEQLLKVGKSSHILNWVITNVLKTSVIPGSEWYELSKENLENLLDACNRTRRYSIAFSHVDSYGDDVYSVDETVAKSILPLLTLDGHTLFPYQYGNEYAKQVLLFAEHLIKILSTTNFETHSIYFRYR